MKIDFSQELLNLKGEPLLDQDTNKPVTLSIVCVEALLAVDKTAVVEGVEKLSRYNLALAIHKGDKDSLTAEEVVLLKELVGKYYSTIIVGQVYTMLDGS